MSLKLVHEHVPLSSSLLVQFVCTRIALAPDLDGSSLAVARKGINNIGLRITVFVRIYCNPAETLRGSSLSVFSPECFCTPEDPQSSSSPLGYSVRGSVPSGSGHPFLRTLCPLPALRLGIPKAQFSQTAALSATGLE